MPPPGHFVILTGTGYAAYDVPLDAGLAQGKTSWALLESLRRGTAAVWLVEVDLPGLVLRIGTTGYDSDELGQYEPLVRSIGGLTQQGSDRSGRMAARQASVRFTDSTRQFKQIEQGTLAHQIKGSAARIKLASPDVPASSWRPEFVGEVQSWSYPSETGVELVIRTFDRPLKRKAPGPQWTLPPPEWPNIDGSAKAQYAPILYGNHDSQVYTNRGLIPLLPVDTVNFWWLLCAGWGGVQRLYLNDVLITASDYELLHVTRKGKLYTLVQDNAATHWKPTDKITADATGYENLGDGMGSLITNPADQIVHLLTNFVFHQWKSGRWLGVSNVDPMIDSLLYEQARAWFESRGYAGAFRVTNPIDGYQALATWAQTHGIRVYWTAAGQIGMKVEDPCSLDLYGLPALRQGSGFKMTYDDAGCTRSITANYAFSEADSRALATQEVTDPTASEADLEPTTLDLKMSQVS